MRPHNTKPEDYYIPAPVAGKFLPITKAGRAVERDCVGNKKGLAEIFDFQSKFTDRFIIYHVSNEPYIDTKVSLQDSSGHTRYIQGSDLRYLLNKYGYQAGVGVDIEYKYSADYGRIYIKPV